MMLKSESSLRALWGALYVMTVLICIILGFAFFKALMLIFSLLCLREFFIITTLSVQLSGILLSTLIIGMLIDFFLPHGGIIRNPVILLMFLFPALIAFEFFSDASSEEKLRRIAYVIFALFYIFIPFTLACQLYLLKGKKLLLGIFLLIWINDTFAYLTGKCWGKRKLTSDISPGKTMEGFLGGVTFCMVTAVVFYYVWSQSYWLGIGLIVGIFGTLGDLVESLIKRACRVKDSSNWFPGHGGFLDRLDSFIFVMPVVMIYITLFY